MLEIIKKLDSGTIKGLIVVTIPLLVLIASFFGVDEALFQTKLEGLGEKLVALVSLFGVAWAGYARLFKPTPPLTETAAQATVQRLMEEEGSKQKNQGGYAHVGALALIAASIMALAGCTMLGVKSGGGFNDRLAGGYSGVTIAYEAISVRLDTKVRIANAEPDPAQRDALLAAAKADAQNLKDQVDKAKEGLDVVRTLKEVDFGAAEERLASTLIILEALQRYLEGK